MRDSWGTIAASVAVLFVGVGWSLAEEPPLKPADLGSVRPAVESGAGVEEYRRALRLDVEMKAPMAGYDEMAPATDEATGEELRTSIRVTFRKASAEIQPDRGIQLENFVKALRGARKPEALRLRLEGHASTEGDPRFNQWLSEARAKAVAAYLVEYCGLDEKNLYPIGKGTADPIIGPDGLEDRSASRRVEVIRLWDAPRKER